MNDAGDFEDISDVIGVVEDEGAIATIVHQLNGTDCDPFEKHIGPWWLFPN